MFIHAATMPPLLFRYAIMRVGASLRCRRLRRPAYAAICAYATAAIRALHLSPPADTPQERFRYDVCYARRLLCAACVHRDARQPLCLRHAATLVYDMPLRAQRAPRRFMAQRRARHVMPRCAAVFARAA